MTGMGSLADAVPPLPLGALPQVGVIDPAPIGEKRVDDLEEGILAPGCLGRGMQGGRAGMLAGHRKVAKHDSGLERANPLPGLG